MMYDAAFSLFLLKALNWCLCNTSQLPNYKDKGYLYLSRMRSTIIGEILLIYRLQQLLIYYIVFTMDLLASYFFLASSLRLGKKTTPKYG